MRAYALAVGLSCLGLPVLADELSLIGRYEWETNSVVGVSGIEVTDQGQGFIAVSDRG